MFFKQKRKAIFSIDYYNDTEYDIHIAKNLNSNDIANIGSFIFLLTYSSPIGINIIDKLKQIKNNNNISSNIDGILNTWASCYLRDKQKPMVEPLSAFKADVK